jgi:hypothetical protein
MLLQMFLAVLWLLGASAQSAYSMDGQTHPADNQSSKPATAVTPAPTFYKLKAYATFSDDETSILTCDQSELDINKIKRFNTRLYLQGKHKLAQKVTEIERQRKAESTHEKKNEPRASITELARMHPTCGEPSYFLTRSTPSHEVKSYLGKIILRNIPTSQLRTINTPDLVTWDVADLAGKTVLAYTTNPVSSITIKDLTAPHEPTDKNKPNTNQDIVITLPQVDRSKAAYMKIDCVRFGACLKDSASLAIIKQEWKAGFSMQDFVYLIDVTRSADGKLFAQLREKTVAQADVGREQIRKIGWTRDGEKLMVVRASWFAAQPFQQLSKSVTAEIYCAKSGKLIAKDQLPQIAWNAPIEGKGAELSTDYSTIITCNLLGKTSSKFARALAFHDVRQERESRIPSKNIVHLLGDRQLTHNRVLFHRKTAAQQAIQQK